MAESKQIIIDGVSGVWTPDDGGARMTEQLHLKSTNIDPEKLPIKFTGADGRHWVACCRVGETEFAAVQNGTYQVWTWCFGDPNIIHVGGWLTKEELALKALESRDNE